MLKKILHIVFAFLILLGGTGMTISKHYCGDTLKATTIILNADNCCDIPINCCHNESITVKIVDDFAITANNFNFNSLEISLDFATILFHNIEITEKSSILNLLHLTPPLKIQTVLSKLQAYLI